jgi:hypothetical protein
MFIILHYNILLWNVFKKKKGSIYFAFFIAPFRKSKNIPRLVIQPPQVGDRDKTNMDM